MTRIDIDRDPQAVLELYRTDPAALRVLVHRRAQAHRHGQLRWAFAQLRRIRRSLGFLAWRLPKHFARPVS